jgi:hypothetical protein
VAKVWRCYRVSGRTLLDRASSILNGVVPLDPIEGDGVDGAAMQRATDDLFVPILSGVYHLRGLLNMFQRQLDDASVDAEQSLALRRKSGDLKNAADTLNLCGSIAMQKGTAAGDYVLLDQAEEYYKESLEIREGLLSRSDPDIGQVTICHCISTRSSLANHFPLLVSARAVGLMLILSTFVTNKSRYSLAWEHST